MAILQIPPSDTSSPPLKKGGKGGFSALNILKGATVTLIAIITSWSMLATAASAQKEQELRQLIETIVNQRTQKLQTQVNQLQSQVHLLKGKLRESDTHSSQASKPAMIRQKQVRTAQYSSQLAKPTRPTNHGRRPANFYRGLATQQARQNFALNALYLGGVPVFSSPYIGIHSEFDGSNLVVNAPSINLDVRLLKQTEAFEEYLAAHGVPRPDNPIIDLSGKVEAQGAISRHVKSRNTNTDLDLASAEIDVFAQMSSWVNGFMAFTYDNSATTPVRTANSRVFLEQGFITLGNLRHSPHYASMGQLYAPLGRYSSYMLSAPLPMQLARTRARALVVGSAPRDHGFYGTAYVFSSNTLPETRRAGGGSLGYQASFGHFTADLNAGIISNLAESEGMQSTGAPPEIPFSGFGRNHITERLKHGVPAGDLNATFGLGPFSLLAEYVGALGNFSRCDMTFNGDDASPQAFHMEGAYHFHVHGDKPANVALAYEHTKEALALFLPQNRYLIGLNISFLRNTLASLEYRHDNNYALTDTATGAHSFPFSPFFSTADMLTAQFGIYF